MKTKSFLSTAITICLITLVGCIKEPLPIFHNQLNKLMLSNIRGSVSSEDSNFLPQLFNSYYTYLWSGDPYEYGPNSGKFQTNFSYNDKYPSYKQVSQESFLNDGKYLFSYDGLFADSVINHSRPGQENVTGYWKLYYNIFKQLSKTGISFDPTTSPVVFEYYTRDYFSQIKSFVYGKSVDIPYMKVLYQYDLKGNISSFSIYVAKNQAIPFNNFGSIFEKISQTKGYATENLNTKIFEKKLPVENIKSQPSVSDNISQAFAEGIDTSVYYFYLSATVYTDNKINPYSQQNNIFFYQTDRWYSFYDITPFYLCLLKCNPLKIEYNVPTWGPDVSTQTFSYTYNNQGYPLTVHEEFNDPDFAFIGSYTKDSQIEYISSH